MRIAKRSMLLIQFVVLLNYFLYQKINHHIVHTVKSAYK